ncbi:MAG: PH domain-containing protein [Bacillales bacterium]|nr:PH domain-containing protein [Bacillales bacterium]
MAYIKFKELTKYFDFRLEVDTKNLPEYTIEYLNANEDVLLAYKNSRDYALFTGERMILFDRDALGLYYKKIHIIPYNRISTCAINFKPGKVELLCSLDSGYQMHLNFIDMNHDKKEKIKEIFKIMMAK